MRLRAPSSVTEPGPTTPRRASSGRAVDPWAVGVGIVALVVFALHGYDGILERDLSVYLYAGQRVVDGVPPYLGVLNRAGPLSHLLPAVGVGAARLLGLDEVLATRFLFTLFAAACASAIYLLGRDLFRSRYAGLASAAALVSFSGFVEYATNGPREKTPMMFFLILALWALTRRRWFAAGLFLSLATLTLQIAFFFGAPALAVVWALQSGPGLEARVRAAMRIVVGGLVPLVTLTAYFWLVDAARAFLDAFVVINARYTVPGPFADDPEGNWARLDRGLGLSLWVLVIGLLAVLALTAVAWVLRKDGDAALRADLAGLTASVLTGIAWTLRDFDSWPDAFPLMPLAAVGVGGLVALVSGRVTVRQATALTVVWCLVAGGYAVAYSVSERDHRLDRQRASVKAVLGVLPDDATIVSIQAPQPLVLSRKINPSRHQMFMVGLSKYVDDTWPGGTRGYQRWVRRQRPDLIAIGSPRPRYWASAFAADYVAVGCAPDWRWFARRSLGDTVLERLRDAAEGPCGHRVDGDPTPPATAG